MITAIPSLPTNSLQTLPIELEKSLRLIDDARTPTELNIAERYFDMFVAKWELASKKYPSPIITAISDKIFTKRNQWVLEDIEHEKHTSIKNAA
jgi:hypothetical protein